MARRRVVFPEPLGPRRPVIFPWGISRLTFFYDGVLSADDRNLFEPESV